MHSTPAAPDLNTTLDGIHEFPEWLAPVVVKELRQGLRSGLFVLPFILLPFVLATAVVWALINNLAEARATVGGFFWAALAIPVAVITPLRALGAIRREQVNNTFDLLQLTPLTGWRIVTGKWYSLLAQAGLWVVALLPFFVLRYFFGRMDVMGEITGVVWTFLGGAMLTAIGLFISTFRHPLLGIGAALAVGMFASFTLVPLVGIMAQGMFGRGFGSGVAVVVGHIFLLMLAAGVTAFSLALTVSRVAPPPPYHPRHLAAPTPPTLPPVQAAAG